MEKTKEIKNEYIVSFNDRNIIIDTILDNGTTKFIIFDKKSKVVEIKDNYFMGSTRYLPMKSSYNLIKNKILLFPSGIADYGNKEKLLLEIRSYIYKYVDIPDNFREIVLYYVLLSYVYQKFSEIPYLRLLGDYGSGKSRLLRVVASICYNPILISGGTSLSAIFRTINKIKGTLMLDEADYENSGTDADIIKLLNNGYQKGVPLMRADGDNFDPNSYDIYCPKIIGGRYEYKDKATESRCLTNIMQRSSRKDIPTTLDDEFYEESQVLRNKLMKFRYDNLDKISIKKDMIEGIEPRLSQIINPILSLVGNSEIEESIIESVRKKQKEIILDRKNSIIGGILGYLKIYFIKNEDISFADIIKYLDIVEGRHYINNRKLGAIFKQNGIISVRKNYGTVIQYIENENILLRLYKEYGIE